MLAHKAEEEGVDVADYIHSGYDHVNYGTIPSVVYTHPKSRGSAGWSRTSSRKASSTTSADSQFIANSRAKTNLDTEGQVKFLVEKETDRILGVHIIGTWAGPVSFGTELLSAHTGPNAGEMLA